MSFISSLLQCLTVKRESVAYDERLCLSYRGSMMRYPYDLLVAVCLAVVVMVASVMLALN
ncbi:hypothetical protein [Paraburkholderia dilworthii]|uniref:hypothetical protein n=1 Tax=Paraburkholderia dilworthii TaxID=948106 RepID=UPI00040A085D|nr:hypothetical protein [Paraburkholderia dilworthii]